MKLSEKARNILNNESFIENQNNWMKRLENLFNGVPDPYLDDHVFILDGIEGHSSIDPYLNPEGYIIDCLEDLAKRVDETKKEYTFVPACISYMPYGVHFVDKLFGAEVFYKDDQWWSNLIKSPIGELSNPDLNSNEFFNLAKRACQAFLDQNVKLPFFGHPTIASVLNIIINLYGEEILIAMLTEKEKTLHDLRIIQDTLLSLHRWYLNTVPKNNFQPVIPGHRTQPYNYGQICGCSTALISSGCYKEMIEPLDAELLGTYPNGGMIHLCGSHLQHIDSFRNMKQLRSVQVNDRAAWDLEVYHKQLREDQILYLNPCKEMTVDMALKITGGHRLIVVGDQKGFVFKQKVN